MRIGIRIQLSVVVTGTALIAVGVLAIVTVSCVFVGSLDLHIESKTGKMHDYLVNPVFSLVGYQSSHGDGSPYISTIPNHGPQSSSAHTVTGYLTE